MKSAAYGNDKCVVASVVFGGALVLMYTTSTLFHTIPFASAKHVLRVADHSMIYVLIAGTYTPYALVTLHGLWGLRLLGFVWSVAVVGIAFKIFFTGRLEFLSVVLYLLMGWSGLVALGPLAHTLPAPGLWWLFVGGFCYSVGIIFYAWERLRYNHAIWHLFVLAGSICHFVSVWAYVIPGPGV